MTTVDVPGHGVVALPPVCLPYSPEFRPALADRGQVTLERLAHTTGGMERLDLPSIWKDLPRQKRLLPIGRWLMLAAVGLWLVEVLERRTSVLSNLAQWKRREPAEDEVDEPAPAPVLPVKRAKPQPQPAAGDVVLPDVPAGPEEAPAPMPEIMPTSRERGDVIEAMRRARARLRGRSDT
jgi:hypothetical protein